MNKIIDTEKAPMAIGPYSQAVVSGNMIFVSGQLPINPETGEFPADNVIDQTKQSMENLKAVLEAGGFGLEDIVKTTIYLHEITDFSEMNEVYGGYFTDNYPARAAYAVKNLPKGALVEIEAIACK